MIVRVNRKDHPYVTIDRRTVCNNVLSWQAKGLLAYLITLPANTRVRVSDLIGVGPDGSQRVQSALHELAEHGYAELETVRNSKGHITGKQWIIYESPSLHKWSTDEPESGLSADEPESGL